MTSGGSKYHLPMSRVQRLPPIREETSGRMSKSPFIGISPDVKSRPRPRSHDSPVKQRAAIHIRTLPTKHRPAYTSVSPPSKHAKTIAIPKEPMDISHTLVDGLVADYLHYARYGHIIPVYEGSSSNTCPCCTDRNRENVRSLLGFQHNKGDFSEETSLVSSRTKPVAVPANSTGRSWMSYQPLPYASNYLNPEFNRPSAVYDYMEETTSARNTVISGAVIDAGSKYDIAMKKLQGYGREARLGKTDPRTRTPD